MRKCSYLPSQRFWGLKWLIGYYSVSFFLLGLANKLALTYWYEIYYDLWLGGQCFKKIAQMHEKYGALFMSFVLFLVS